MEKNKQKLMSEFLSFSGKASKKVSDNKLRKIKEQVILEIVKEKGWD